MEVDPFSVFNDLSRLGGHIGAIAAVVFTTVRLYRIPVVQNLLPVSLRWSNLDPKVKYGILLVLSGLGGALASLSTDLSALDALKAAAAAMVAAIGSDQLVTSSPVQAAAKVVFDIKHTDPIVPDTSIVEKTPSLPPVDMTTPKS